MEELELEDPKQFLGELERKVISEAESFMSIILPDTQNKGQTAGYITKNIDHQLAINNLRTQINYTKSKVYLDIAVRSSQERELLAQDGFRSSGERDELRFRNSQIKNLKSRYDKLYVISENLEAMEWMLKSKVKVLSP